MLVAVHCARKGSSPQGRDPWGLGQPGRSSAGAKRRWTQAGRVVPSPAQPDAPLISIYWLARNNAAEAQLSGQSTRRGDTSSHHSYGEAYGQGTKAAGRAVP
jgi:hypothetical protein